MATKKQASLHDLFLEELKDLYDVEQRLVKALPKMAKRASNPDLRMAFESHLEETKGQVARLEKVFELLKEKPRRKTCHGIMGILEEGEEAMKHPMEDAVRDAALIASAQRVEHYEMAAYGAVRSFAEKMGHSEEAKLLQQTLDEEGAADKKLTDIAESEVNDQAMEPAMS